MWDSSCESMQRIQNERIAAFRDYRADVIGGGYPAAEHTVPIKDEEFDAFVKLTKG